MVRKTTGAFRVVGRRTPSKEIRALCFSIPVPSSIHSSCIHPSSRSFFLFHLLPLLFVFLFFSFALAHLCSCHPLPLLRIQAVLRSRVASPSSALIQAHSSLSDFRVVSACLSVSLSFPPSPSSPLPSLPSFRSSLFVLVLTLNLMLSYKLSPASKICALSSKLPSIIANNCKPKMKEEAVTECDRRAEAPSARGGEPSE